VIEEGGCQNAVMVDGKMHPQPYVTRYVECTIPYRNVWSEYAAWYNPQQVVNVEDRDFEFKFWKNSELSTWIEENTQSTVLIQRQYNISVPTGWSIGFVSHSDSQRFNAWYYPLLKKTTLEVDLTEGDFNLMNEWIKENVRGKHSVRRGFGSALGRVTATVAIQNDPDAFHFKMRWYNAPDTVTE
jgi:hypothetical protein